MNSSPAKETTDDLLDIIQGTFYREVDRTVFYRDLKGLIYAITWPAKWMKERGLRMTAKRYERFILDRIAEVKEHSDPVTRSIYFPRYLLKCLQEHLAHQGDALYDELKHARNAVDLALQHTSKIQETDTHTIDILAHAHTLTRPRRRKAKHPSQLSLF